MTYLEQNERSGRVIFPDVVRAFALIGIALVNVAYFAHPLGDYNVVGALNAPQDQVAYFGVTALFLMKSYTLFSFMFGVGFAFQITSAARRETGFGAQYSRRITGLLMLGILHAAFLFQGDILFIYGLLGAVLLLFRNKSTASLLRWAKGLYIVQIVIIGLAALAMWAGETFDPESMADVFAEFEVQEKTALLAFGEGGFTDAMMQRLAEWSEYVIFGLMFQGLGALSFFLFGLAAVKSGVLNDADAPIWKRFRRVFLPIGILGSLFGAYMLMKSSNGRDADMMIGMALIILFAPFSTAGYLGLIAKWVSGPMTALKIFMARGGTSTLTAYLMQSLILSVLFNNYGFGLFGKLGAGSCIAIALIVSIFTVAFASFWRKKFKRGPMEYLLRAWTYLGKS